MLKLIIIISWMGVFIPFQCLYTAAQGSSSEAKYEALVNQVLGNFRDVSNDLLKIRTGLRDCSGNLHELLEARKNIELIRLEILEIRKILENSPKIPISQPLYSIAGDPCPKQDVVPVPQPTPTADLICNQARSSSPPKASDHVLLYRPGTGTIWILQNQNGSFSPVYAQGDPGNGIAGYDLRSTEDRILAFDYDHSGRQDHLVIYRPGTGTIWILKNENGKFKPVYQQGDPGIGIGGYNLKSPADRVFAIDYDRSGLLDHLALYRPGTGTIWILKNDKGNFIPVFQQGDPGQGIGGYDLRSPVDRVLAFDY